MSEKSEKPPKNWVDAVQTVAGASALCFICWCILKGCTNAVPA